MTDFKPVTRKKWLARRCLQRPRRTSDCIPEHLVEVDLTKFMERFERLCGEMRLSDYFIQAMATVEKSVQDLSGDFKLQRIICLGLGPFTRTFQALHQFAFIAAAQRHLGIEDNSYFDPVFSAVEKDILQNLKYKVMHENCEGKYVANVATLFYLPHCPNCLTNNLLWRNWQRQHLPNACIINNSFASLICSKPKRLLQQDASYILKIQNYVQEQALDDDYETHNVFNDLSVHTFPPHILPAAGHELWHTLEAPIYEHDNENELITTATIKIEKLALT